MSGWRLNQPKVTLLASAFFVEWTLPTFTLPHKKSSTTNTNSTAVDPKSSATPRTNNNNNNNNSNTTIFTPEPEALVFTCEWKAASSLDSTKLEFKGDTTCCLVPIEWAEEDVVMRLSFRFVESILLPDGTRAPTTTIFDGERCIVRSRRAAAMPLLIPHASSTLKSTTFSENVENRNNSNTNLAGVTCAQVLRSHPALVDAFSLSLLRRGNDVSQLECGPWMGSIEALLSQLDDDHDSSSSSSTSFTNKNNNKNNNNKLPDTKKSPTTTATKQQDDFFKLPTKSRKYHGCAILNGVKLDVWEVSYKRSRQSGIDFSFFTTEHESSVAPRHLHRHEASAATTKLSIVVPSASPAFAQNYGSNVSSPQGGAAATLVFAENASDVNSVKLSTTKKISSSFNASHQQVAGSDHDDDDNNNEGEDDSQNRERTQQSQQPLNKTATSTSSSSQSASPSAKDPSIQQQTKQTQQQSSFSNFDEDIIIFLSAHDGLDEVDTFENRKLTDRLNPLNITKAFFEEWLSKPNLVICVCGAFSFGQYAVIVAEQLLREFDSKKPSASSASSTMNQQQQSATSEANTAAILASYVKPRIICATFASNPPRLSQADTTGRLKRKENVVIRAQNHFLHVAPIIEAPVVAPDDLPNLEIAANSRRARSLDFVDYFLGECASFAVGKNFLSIVLESYLERQNCYDQHATMMTAQGTAEIVNPILSIAGALSSSSGGNGGGGGGGSSSGMSGGGSSSKNAAENELALASACESPWVRSVVEETATSSGFTPLDVVANIPELVRERSLMQKANIPENLTSVFSSASVLNAFESSLQQHLVASSTEESLAEAALRCEPVITSAEIKSTRLRMAELSLVIQGTNLQFARHVVLRDSSSPRDAVFARSEVEVSIRERSRGFDGFSCKVHLASLLRFVEEISEEDEVQYSGRSSSLHHHEGPGSASSLPVARKSKNMFASSEDLTAENIDDLPPSSSSPSLTNEPLSPASRPRGQTGINKKKTRLVARFDVCVWAENGCAAFVDVIATFPDGLVPWMANSGSWTSKQDNFLSPPVELVSSAARLHVWGSFASSVHLQGGIPLAGTDLPRRLLKGLESASLSLSVVNPQDKSTNFFSRAFKSAKDKLATDPLTMQNAPQVPANLKTVGTEALLKDIPAGSANSHAAAASRARILHQLSTETRALKNFLDPLLLNLPWLNTGVEYRSKVLRAAQLLDIPFENSWYQQQHSSGNGNSSNNTSPSSSSSNLHTQKNLNNTVPVIEALLWQHVSSLLQACGAKIQDSITEVTLKSFCENIGFVLLRHESYSSKKESDGTAFFTDMMMVWIVCIMHELRAFASGTTLVIVSGDHNAGASSVTSLLQSSSSSLRNQALPHSFTWVIDLYPLPDLFGEALLLFPNVALFYVTTLEDCVRDSDVLQLSTTTNSLIQAQRHDVDPASWNRHHQWIVLNKIDLITGVEKSQQQGESSTTSSNNGRSLMKQRMNFAREEFRKRCCPSLQSWNSSDEKNLIPLAVNPQFIQGGATAQEIAELRMRAAEYLKDAVRKISIW